MFSLLLFISFPAEQQSNSSGCAVLGIITLAGRLKSLRLESSASEKCPRLITVKCDACHVFLFEYVRQACHSLKALTSVITW